MDSKVTEVSNVIQKACGMVDGFAKSKGLIITAMQKSEMPKWIETDEIRLKEILVEFLRATVKLTHFGTVALISKVVHKTQNPRLKFQVTGTNLNLTDAVINSTLDPPPKITLGRKQPRISLLNSKNLIELFGGELKIRSKPGKASISFTMPLTVHLVPFASYSLASKAARPRPAYYFSSNRPGSFKCAKLPLCKNPAGRLKPDEPVRRERLLEQIKSGEQNGARRKHGDLCGRTKGSAALLPIFLHYSHKWR